VHAHKLIPPNDRYLLQKPENSLNARLLHWVLVFFDFLKRQLGCDQLDLSFVHSFEQPVKSLRLRRKVVLGDRRDDVVV
jgi:hypothetical protein